MMHVQELKRLGADIEVEGNTAIVKGVRQLDRRQRDGDRSARIGVPRHRRARGRKAQTTIDRIYHLDRGYERIERAQLSAHRARQMRRR